MSISVLIAMRSRPGAHFYQFLDAETLFNSRQGSECPLHGSQRPEQQRPRAMKCKPHVPKLKFPVKAADVQTKINFNFVHMEIPHT